MSTIKDTLKKIPVLYPAWHEIRLLINKHKEVVKKKAYDKYGQDILKDVSTVGFDDGYKITPFYGTLLGIIRDGKLIPWDDDLDFIILNDDKFSWDRFQLSMEKHGFWKFREIYNLDGNMVAQSYKKKGVLCDFSLWDYEGAVPNYLYGCYEIPGYKYINNEYGPYKFWYRSLPAISNLISYQFNNYSIEIPENYFDVLVGLYGIGWEKPDPDYKCDTYEVEVQRKIVYYKK